MGGAGGRRMAGGLTPTTPPRGATAFTLIELILVLALIAALGALVLPSMASRLGGAKTDAMADAVARAVQEASAYSVGSGRACEVRLRTSAKGGELVRRDAADETSKDVVLLELGRDMELTLGGTPGSVPPEDQREEGEEPGPMVILLPDGTAVAPVTRWRLSSGGDRRVLTLLTGTSRVSVDEEADSLDSEDESPVDSAGERR